MRFLATTSLVLVAALGFVLGVIVMAERAEWDQHQRLASMQQRCEAQAIGGERAFLAWHRDGEVRCAYLERDRPVWAPVRPVIRSM